ncbi:uncharacterized protein K452DRAFT_117343 [Aplosporella prunicola CBS 121167]|uniref:Uncharacterized protein n=1 Tax=Aplosporella prunicola CBS 121167 TaxID=1176127 RepID=A0A6A6AY26_9PEZI|nr:uncharacterized protein K452DRAFT_117343 [Aplosporella prunicola CBS 121167]KAF2136839.1 hypothetical protein K452DRAFT_117343 [Aplosporella prunicola CBS 121167]
MTINSIVSWLGLTGKALMLSAVAACLGQAKWLHFVGKTNRLSDMAVYDNASRGFSGSASLLWKSRLRQPAVLGAIVVLCSVAIGPLVQQTIAVEIRSVPVDQQVTIARAQNFADREAQLSFGLTNTIYNAIFMESDDDKDKLSVNATCPTGNCDFHVFQSLAICHRCVDISEKLLTNCTVSCQNFNICTSSLTEMKPLQYTDVGTSDEGAIALSVDENNPSTAQFSLTAIQLLDGASVTEISASQCSLFWCIQEYQSSIRNSILDERILDSWQGAILDSWQMDHIDGAITFHSPTRNNTPASDFNIDIGTASLLFSWFTESFFFNGSVTTFLNDATGCLELLSHAKENNLILPFRRVPLSTLFARLAISLTRRIREISGSVNTRNWEINYNASAGEAHAYGTSQVDTPQIQVRWAWMALPGTLWVLAVLFVMLTVNETRRAGIAAWKTSAMPLLSSGLEGMGLDEETREMLYRAPGPVEMERVAQEVWVRGNEGGEIGAGLLRSEDAV